MIKQSFTVVPIDNVLKEVNSCFGMSVNSAVDLMRLLESKNSHWLRLANWEDLTDAEIFRNFERKKASFGKVYIVNEVSYRNGLGAFDLEGDEIKSFVDHHLVNFGECFFNGDVLIISAEKGLIWAFHHEGSLAIFDVPSVLRTGDFPFAG